MKVRLVLGVAPLVVFPVIAELEIEVASGTFLKQSQVRIIGVSADNQNQWRTIVDIDLVPLGEKFDNTTAFLLYERFWHKKVHLNRSRFGDYATLYVVYPGSSFIFSNDILLYHYHMFLHETNAVGIQVFHHHCHLDIQLGVVPSPVKPLVFSQSLLPS